MPTEVWGLRTGSPGGGYRASHASGSVELAAKVLAFRVRLPRRWHACAGMLDSPDGARNARGSVKEGRVGRSGFARGSVELVAKVWALRVRL